jgi:hypothetical protein
MLGDSAAAPRGSPARAAIQVSLPVVTGACQAFSFLQCQLLRRDS